MTKDNFLKPDYYELSKPKTEEKLIKRKCFAFGKEKEGGIEAMSEDALTGDVQELKQLLQILK